MNEKETKKDCKCDKTFYILECKEIEWSITEWSVPCDKC
jgi:hypothetical protein